MSGVIAPRTYRPGDLIYEEKVFAQALFRPVACENCHISSLALKLCTGCREVKYCSKACQRADWSEHKLECKHLKNLTKSKERYFVRLLGKVILKIKGKDWKSIQRQVLKTNVTFDDIVSFDIEREGSVKSILFLKEMKELTRKYIGEENMPREEDFYNIVGKVLSSNAVGMHAVSSMAGFVVLGLSKFGRECIPNTNLTICKNVLKIWACKEIRKGSEKNTVWNLNHLPMTFFGTIDTLNSKCKCTDCSLPYGESVLTKIVDENRALSVICETESLLKAAGYLLELPFGVSARQVDELLKKQEEVLGDTNVLHLKLLEFKCFGLGDHPYRLKEFLKKYEECARKVYGDYFAKLEDIYVKYIDVCFQLGNILEAQLYMKKLKKVKNV